MPQRMCVSCGRVVDTLSRNDTPTDCPSPDACSLDLTTEEAMLHWRHRSYEQSKETTIRQTGEPVKDAAAERLIKDAYAAVQVLEAFEAFPTAQGILRECAKAITAMTAERDAINMAISEKGGTIHAPTQWAYDQACAALAKTKAERDAALAGVGKPETCPSCDGTGHNLYDGTAHDCQVCGGRMFIAKTDLARLNTLIGAAYEAAAQRVRGVIVDHPLFVVRSKIGEAQMLLSDEVLKGTPADALSALDRIRKEAREEGIREAAAKVSDHIDNRAFLAKTAEGEGDAEDAAFHRYAASILTLSLPAIFALLTKEPKNEPRGRAPECTDRSGV